VRSLKLEKFETFARDGIRNAPTDLEASTARTMLMSAREYHIRVLGGPNLAHSVSTIILPKSSSAVADLAMMPFSPTSSEVTDPVPVEWRPLKCFPQDVCVDFGCHEDATCIVTFLEHCSLCL
jgi:hypothetical protein